MTISDPQSEKKYRLFFKQFNQFMLGMWRLGFRRWVNSLPPVFGRIMVITHIGRRSGLPRRTPVNYALLNGELYCTAGFGPATDWYRNLLAHPEVEVWLPSSWWAGTAEDVTSREDFLPILRQVIINSGLVAPMMGLHPRKMTDAEFATSTRGYRLIHIQRTRHLNGRSGPGDLAWVWSIPAIILLFFFLVKICA